MENTTPAIANQSPVEVMKAQLAAKMQERKAQLSNILEERKILIQMAQIESPLYEKRFMEEQDNQKLDAIISHIEDMYAENRRKVTQVFGFGVIVNKLLIIVQAIQYSKIDEKQELLALSGLAEQTVEDIVDAYGATAYFSPRELEIKPAIPMDLGKLKELLTVAAFDMGLVSDMNFSKLNQANIDSIYKRAELRAEEMYENTMQYETNKIEYDE